MLLKCSAFCKFCANQCLNEHNIEMLKDCIRLDNDCSDVCETTANYLIRESGFCNDLVKICEQICRQCSDECLKHEHEHCKECAKICKECEEMCEAFK